MEEKWIDCLGPNLPTVLFYLCDEAQEKLSEKNPDFEKASADQLMDAIADKLEVANATSSLYVDTVLGIELKIQLNQQPGLQKILVDVASFDERYGAGTGNTAVNKAKEAWLQAYVAEKPRLCDGAKGIVLACFSLLASFVFAETEVVDGIEWTFSKYTDDYKVYYSLLSSPAIPCSTTGDIVIPCRLGGRPVLLQRSSIDSGAFQYCTYITSVVIPDGITGINGPAFWGCKSLTNVVIRSSAVTRIGRHAFTECRSLEKVELPQGLQYLDTSAFSNCKALKGLTLPSSIKRIGENAFGGCSSLTVLKIPSNVSYVGANAFEGCSSLTNITWLGRPPTVDGTTIFKDSKSDLISYVRADYGWESLISGGIWQSRAIKLMDSVPTPVFISEHTFTQSNHEVAIEVPLEGSIIRYTTDGSEATKDASLYVAPLRISESTTIRARAYGDGYIESEEAILTFTRLWLTNETPVVEAASATFATASQTVTLSCATDGAAIYYTIDGSEPSAANGRLYKGPFDVYQTTTVKAVAAKDDWKDSEVAVATFTKENALGPALNLLEMLPDNDKAHPWTVVTDVTHDGVSAVRSGEISDDESTTMKVVIYGAGELSFWWRTSCEPSIDDEWYDYATFYDGSTAVAKLAGATDWQRVVRTVEGTGKHTFKWTYQKDGSGSTVPDGVWVDQVQWLPKTDDWYSDHTLTTETPVPYAWLDRFGLGRTTDFETAAKAKSGKVDGAGRALTVEEEYVAGTDPTNAASRIETRIEMRDGAPVVTWTPDLNEGGAKTLRTYKVWGKETLGASEWEYPTNALHRFFRVTVEMP